MNTSSLRILYISSDNNLASGAFLSMSTLCEKMEYHHGVHAGVILPKKGSGKSLLDKANIENKTIRNFDWIVSKYSRRDFRFKFKRNTESLWNYMSAVRIAKYILNNKYDIVHINTTYSYVGILAARLTRRPTVWHIRELLEEDQNRTIWCKKKGYGLINEAEKIITISDTVRDKYKNILDWNKIRMIYNGVKIETFFKEKKEIMTAGKKPILLFVGQLNKMKGCFDLIDACRLLNQKNIDYEVWFIGKESPEFESILENSGIKNKSKCFGFRSDVDRYYEKADIALICSKVEAFGRITVEAMLSGNLVIGSNTGCTEELIEHGLTGLQFKQGDVSSLAKTIEYALDHVVESKAMAYNGREFAYANLSADHNCNAIYDEYLKIKDESLRQSFIQTSLMKIVVNAMSPLCCIVQNIIKITYNAIIRLRDNVIDIKDLGFYKAISQKLNNLVRRVN